MTFDENKSQLTITWVPQEATGQELVKINSRKDDVSLPTYTEGYYIAYLNYHDISGTGSTYTDALGEVSKKYNDKYNTKNDKYNTK